jgi:micrococcal nuclease
MRDSTVVKAAIVIGAFGYAVSFCASPTDDRASDLPGSTSTTTSSVVTTAEPTTTTTTTPTTTTEDDVPAQFGGVVTRVVDGDTLDVNDDVRVRLIGVDTPEVYGGVECYGPEASEQANHLAWGKEVRLELDPTQGTYDKYDRLLAYVWFTDGRMLNDMLITGGYGREYLYAKEYKYRNEFIAAEIAAQARDVGLWGAC